MWFEGGDIAREMGVGGNIEVCGVSGAFRVVRQRRRRRWHDP